MMSDLLRAVRPRLHDLGKIFARPSHMLAVVATLLVVSAVLICGLSIATLHKNELTSIQNRLEVPAQGTANVLQAIARNADMALRHLQELGHSSNFDIAARKAMREDMLVRGKTVVAIKRVQIYDLAGKAIAAEADQDVANYDFFQRQIASTHDSLLVSGLIADPADGKSTFVLSRRIADDAGQVHAVVSVFIDTAYLQKNFNTLELPQGSSITLFNAEGHVLMRTPAIELGDPVLGVDFSGRPMFLASHSGDAKSNFLELKTITGVERYIAGVGSKTSPFVVSVGWDTEKALAHWRSEAFAIATGTAAAIALVISLFVYLIWQIRRNEALLGKVTASEEKHRNLLNALPDAVMIIDQSLCIEFANPAAERLHGYEPGGMSGQSISALMAHPAGTDGSVRNVMNSGPTVMERMGIRKDGKEMPIEISTRPYDTDAGSKLIVVVRDVSRRWEYDLALRRSQESLVRSQRMASLGSFDRDLLTNTVECSEAFREIWGLRPDETPSAALLLQRVHPDDRVKFMESRGSVLSGKPVTYSDFRIIRPDGEERILHHEYMADFNPDGTPARIFGIIQDITDRKRIEMALRRSRENLARAQSVAAIGSFDRDLATARTEWSDEFLAIWGITETPTHGTAELLLSLVVPEDREKFLAGRDAALQKRSIPPLDFRIVRPDGEERILHREYGVVFDDDGKPIRMFGTIQDITERKRIENELRQSRENLTRAQRIAGLGSFSRDLITGKIERSEEFLRIWGIDETFSPDASEPLLDMVHPEDREKFIANRDASRDGAPTPLEFRIIRTDGEERLIHREYGVIRDETGKPINIFGIIQDITERKRAEAELKHSRENLARAQRIAGIASFERDLITGKFTWSDEMYRIHGADPTNPAHDAAYLRTLIHPEDRGTFDDVRAMAEKGIAAPPLDYRIILPDGSERILHRECDLFFDEAGRPIRLIATMQDITERRRVEIQLRRSQDNMLRAQRIAAMGSFERDLVTNRGDWSDELYRIFGLERSGEPPSYEKLLTLVHPDDRVWLEGTRRAELIGAPSMPVEYRLVRSNGEVRTVRRECDVIFDDEHKPMRVYGTIQDVTERKQVELEAVRSRENMERAQQIAALGSFEHNLVTGHTEWSDEMYRLLGLRKGEHKPGFAQLISVVHPQDRDKFQLARGVEDKGFSPAPFEYRIIRADGEERVLRRESDVVTGEDGRLQRIFGTLQDITERRLSESRERELERQLLHSQKLEALGTLAGGIAHDLNNTLVPIMALSKLTARRFEAGNQVRSNLETIFEASERARDLVRRVLAFSRKDDPEKQEIGLAEIVREALKLLRATVPTSIQLDASVFDVPSIPADGSQIHQIITNLVSNAAGAIGNEMGVITVSLDTHRTADGKDEICLSVADTGIGMNQATIQRMFEPFFTTKEVGQGTGLGLSIVHGIVTGHGGRIEVKSELGKGSRFDLYFPVPDAAYAGMIAAITSSRPAA